MRDHWELPAAGGRPQPLRYFSPRVITWSQPEYQPVGDLAAWLRRAAREGLEGVCLGREVGSWMLLFSVREGHPYLAHSLRMDLAQFTFRTMARQPELTEAEFEQLLAQEFLGLAERRQAAALLYLDDLLLRITKGLGPAGNYYTTDPGAFRELLEKAVDPARSTALQAGDWREVFLRGRAVRQAAALEGNQVGAVAATLADLAPRISPQARDRFALVEKEVSFLQSLLLLEEDAAGLLARAWERARRQVPLALARVSATSENSGAQHAALNLFDGRPETNWLCRNAVPTPQSVTVELPAAKEIQRVTVRQSSQRLDYNTRRYRIEGSPDGYHFETWLEGELPRELGAVRIHELRGRRARFLRLVVLSIYPDAPYSSPALSEWEIQVDGRPMAEWLGLPDSGSKASPAPSLHK